MSLTSAPARLQTDPATNPTGNLPTRAGDVPLSPTDFSRIAAFAHREFGLFLPAAKRDLVQSRLQKLLKQTGHSLFSSFCDQLENGNANEQQGLISALTTNVTHFFREPHHFKLLTERNIQPLRDELRNGRRLRIWSAGCSAGQEPLSIALTLLDQFPEADRMNVRILATDIDPAILARARNGLYPEEEAQGIPEPLRRRFLQPGPPGQVRLAPQVCGMIRHAELNLIGDWPLRGPFDAIFCRNVAIYFDKPTQARLWSRFTDLLTPGGLLCIGHSERVAGPALERLESLGMTAYQRNYSPQRAERTTG